MAKPDKVEDKTKKALTVAAVILLIGVATIAIASALSPDEAAGKVCKASFEGQGYVCPWSPPWWWPFSDCMWYGLTCARSAG
jgi:hypothetical protein